MSREDLLAARARVMLQLERLRNYGIFGRSGGDPHAPLEAQLNAILREIEDELADLKSRP